MTPLCARLDADTADRLFFGAPDRAGKPRHRAEETEAARHLCAACPLREACLDDALRTPPRHDRHGIRAGLMPAERQALRVRWQVTVADTGEEWTGGPIGRPGRTLAYAEARRAKSAERSESG